MKNSIYLLRENVGYYLFIFGFILLLTACKENSSKDEINKTETEKIVEINYTYWNVKAVDPKGKSLDIKAFDNTGKSYDIMGIQDADQDIFLDVKALDGEEKLPVKMLVSSEQFVPVKVINNEGILYDVKAVTEAGDKLDVKGIRRFGNIIIMKAITKEGKYIGVKAISPEGKMNDVKGIKLLKGEQEMTLNGVSVNAHVKAMHPAANEAKFKMYKKSEINKKRVYRTDFERIIWSVKAVTADGKNLDVKVIDAEGNQFDVQALQNSEQHSFMDVKALVGGYMLPVKIMLSGDKYAPVKAINNKGDTFEIKAITEDNVQLDVMGISRSGRIINIKAIDQDGEFLDIKAISPDGKVNFINGIKILDRDVEMKLQDQSIYAHVKALHQ